MEQLIELREIHDKDLAQLKLYRTTMNMIEDYLEYRYMSAKSIGEIKEHIMGIVDNLTRELGKLQNQENN